MPITVGAAETGRDTYIIRHRNPIGDRFVIVSRTVLFGYSGISDGAKLTYWVIYSHDWYGPGGEGRKGYVWPTIARIARLRHTTERTIQRHLAELIHSGLLTRVLRRGKPSILYIEEPSETTTPPGNSTSPGGDEDVGGGVTFLSPPLEKYENKKNNNAVNKDESTPQEVDRQDGRGHGWKSLRSLLPQRTAARRGESREEWLAQQILAATGDAHSLGCYRLLTRKCVPELLFEALAFLKEARRDGNIRRSRGALFLVIVRRLCSQRGQPDPLARETATSLPSASRLTNLSMVPKPTMECPHIIGTEAGMGWLDPPHRVRR
jgi:hypothetical protein